MNYVTKIWIALFALLLGGQNASASMDCEGSFPNLVTDVCWNCVFPITFGGVPIPVNGSGKQETTISSVSGAVCMCGINPGVTISFWEPVRHIDVVRKPWCMSTLGVTLDPGFAAPHGNQTIKDNSDMSSFYQAHWYIDPLMELMQLVIDSRCIEQKAFDMAYPTELDPLWNDDEMTAVINPDAFLFGNIPAQLACGADCVMASIGFGSNTLYWCAGCSGPLYPLNGHVAAHVGGVQASSLIAQRLTAKLHREGLMTAASGPDGMCGYYPQLLMDKTDYKYQMLFPVPQSVVGGRCCQPFGRTTVVWGAGKEIPGVGEDYQYMLFRKRDCCQGAF